MGIPAYFAYIAKNHSKIIKKLEFLSKVHNLLFDCNSIIYDAIRELEKENKQLTEQMIFELICKKVEQYIYLVKPTNVIYIAFDGVASIAKLNQQRSRRYKNTFIKYVESNKERNNNWNTVKITPGTEFMIKFTTIVR